MAKVSFKNVEVIDNNGVKTIEKQFEATVVSISSTVKKMNNAKATQFRVATVEFVNASNKTIKAVATIYEKSIEKGAIVKGGKYATNARKGKNADGTPGVFLNVKPFEFGGTIATEDDFGAWDDTETVVGQANAQAAKNSVV